MQPLIMSVQDHKPQIGEGTFLAPSAQLIGEVTLGKNCSIWFNTILRGDVGPIKIGDETNIQDGSIIHCTYNKAFTTIGNRVTVGHAVVMHGCRIDDLVLIGMGTIIMDNAHISSRTIVGAGSLVTENAIFEEGWLVLGRPAKAVRKLRPEELEFLDKSANNYLNYKSWYEKSGQILRAPLTALTAKGELK